MLAIMICTGLDWLGFAVRRGKVLILDNELHEPTLVNRIQQIANALQLPLADFAEDLHVECFRGRLIDIHGVIERLSRIPPGTYKAVILDSLYRFAPDGFDENSNTDTTAMYNLIDAAATRLGCAIICVRHSSKGSQSNKSVTDTGAGAGAQSRAVDAHVVLRAHEEKGAFVMAAALRSFAKLEPIVVRFDWPLFFTAPEFDPAMLASDKEKKPKANKPIGTAEAGWSPSRVAGEFLSTQPQSQAAIIAYANEKGLSERRAKSLLELCTSCKPPLAFLWQTGDRRQKHFANAPQVALPTASEPAE